MLEPYDGKLSRTVLRGVGGRKVSDLPGTWDSHRKAETMVDIDKLSGLSLGVRAAQSFEERYGTHALLRERQILLGGFRMPPYLTEMMRMEQAIRAAYQHVNPFEQMMRNIRPDLDYLRLRTGFDESIIETMRGVADRLARSFDPLAEAKLLGGLMPSVAQQIMETQRVMSEAAMGLRERMSALQVPSVMPHEHVASVLAGIQVLSDRNNAYRETAHAALSAVKGYQMFADRQIERAMVDSPLILQRRMVITDLAGDLLDTAQNTWEQFGVEATIVPESPKTTPAANIFTHLNRQLSYLYREEIEDDADAAFDRSTAARVSAGSGEIADLMYNVNELRASGGSSPMFKPTNRGMLATSELATTVASDKASFGRIVDALYCLLYEGSGDAARLIEVLSDQELESLWYVKTLRTSYRHDIDHGKESRSAKRHLEIGEVYQNLIRRPMPTRSSHWSTAQVALLDRVSHLLRNLFDTLDAGGA